VRDASKRTDAACLPCWLRPREEETASAAQAAQAAQAASGPPVVLTAGDSLSDALASVASTVSSPTSSASASASVAAPEASSSDSVRAATRAAVTVGARTHASNERDYARAVLHEEAARVHLLVPDDAVTAEAEATEHSVRGSTGSTGGAGDEGDEGPIGASTDATTAAGWRRPWINELIQARGRWRPLGPSPSPSSSPGAKAPFVVGFLASDFSNVEACRQVRFLLGARDRETVRTVLVVVGPAVEAASDKPADVPPQGTAAETKETSLLRQPAGAVWARVLGEACDDCIDARGLPTLDAVAAIRAHRIHLMITLEGCRSFPTAATLALQAAPVQVAFLCPCGSTAAPFVQYLITDRVATPPSLFHLVTETVAYMPFSTYGPGEHVSDAAVVGESKGGHIDVDVQNELRAEFGLPACPAPVLCSFDNPTGLEPRLFGAWLSVLKQLPDAVLWLSGPSSEAANNLRAAAIARGIDGSRLLLRPPPRSSVAQRKCFAAATVVLATVGTTATTVLNALRVQTPVLTVPQDLPRSRVAASVLTAACVPEFICLSMKDLSRTAVRLCSSPAVLQEARRRLLASVTRPSPLFDGRRWAADVWALLRKVLEDADVQRAAAGLEPVARAVAAACPDLVAS